MTVKSQQAQRELNRYLEFIRNYELSDKIMGDPSRNAKEDKQWNKTYYGRHQEGLSVIVDDLDDGLQLQPNSN